MIRAGDRVGELLRREPRLLDVFLAASPHFERLRNPALRRVMARLVTVEQAARVAGVDAQALVAQLNRALGEDPAGETAAPADTSVTAAPDAGMPTVLAALPPERVHDLDVRDELRRGEEPFSRIMAAKAALGADDVLRLRAIFEPVPLYHVLGKQGFSHWTERLADDDWRVWFYRPAAGTAAKEPTAAVGVPAAPAPDQDEDVVVLDVRGLEPPEPMLRTLAALEELPPGKTLVQLNVRVPQFLLPRLDELGFSYEVREQNDELVRLFIRRRAP